MSLKVNSNNRSEKPGTALNAEETERFLSQWLMLTETTLAIEVVRSCNLRCPGCWVGISRDDLWTAAVQDTMANGLLQAALCFGRNFGIPNLSLLGGEPTLHPDLADVVRRAKLAGYKSISMTTNGVASSTKMQSVLSSGLTNVSFSVDGSSPEIHDLLRPSPNGESTFQTTIRNLEMAVSHAEVYGYDVHVNHTLFVVNLHDAENMVRFVHNKGVRRIRIHFSMPGDLETAGRSYVKPKDWLALCRRMDALRDELGIEIQVRPIYGEDWVASSRNLKSPYLTIQPDGNLILCTAHARLQNPEARSFAYLENERSIRLNPQSPLFSDSTDNMRCCGALPLLIAEMPEVLRNEVIEAGNMGCILLQSALTTSKTALESLSQN